jgi:hypothetical protein
MVLDARRLQLCTRYFAAHDDRRPRPNACPAGHGRGDG